ncbi:phosphoglucosamine mutase [Altererythrobacter confluentis]|uniref:Phosphoglucosamine mutase n=1 Tax=Allopontixanthobacter confluentis TaxID=1849021 RepID=A0A6L7GI47_9SPHN|nr:phosphoglucosamine mutase [Allopontixanthobacter confluentis]MXP15607.1 phosphoglucosamine mutase [Allopontixanthobacter confluentis]
MGRKFFGTDGIRGRTNEGVMTAATAMRVGQAAGRHFLRGDHRHRVVIGKDTRLSGYMMESALVAGFTSVGMDVVMTGPLPTPAIALLARELRADLGVMISASHNPFEDNGIKLFGPDGFKLSDQDEMAIETAIQTDQELAPSGDIGRARRIEDARGRYIHAVKASLPEHIRFDSLKIVVDCANGAAYEVTPSAIWELGARVITLGVNPNGRNINDGVGSTSLAALKQAVIAEGADIGIALDGDADRLIVIDEKGQTVDGDQIMALIATQMAQSGKLKGGGIVATVMSNLGLERYLESQGLTLERSKVGDRYVLEKMRAGGFNVGGEQSGHMIMLDHATTGDGTIAALQVLGALVQSGKKASELLHMFDPVPQLLKNVRYSGASPLDNAAVQQVIANAEAELAGKGRLVIRASGTEPLIRVMAEGDDAEQVHAVVDRICDAVEKAV